MNLSVEHPDDIQTYLEGVRLVHKLVKTPALQEFTDGIPRFDPGGNGDECADLSRFAIHQLTDGVMRFDPDAFCSFFSRKGGECTGLSKFLIEEFTDKVMRCDQGEW